MFLPFVQRTGRAVSSINVKPQIEFSRDIGQFGERINDAGVDSSRTANDAKRPQALASIGLDLLTQHIDTHSLSLITRDHAHLVASEAENVRGFRDRQVNFFRRVERHRWTGVPESDARRVDARLATMRYQQRYHVCHRAAAR